MTRPNTNLATLRAERDTAMARVCKATTAARQRVSEMDGDLEAFAKNHPVAALGGAVAIGAAVGLFLSGRPVRRLAKAAGLVVFGPLIGDLSERLLRLASGGSEDN